MNKTEFQASKIKPDNRPTSKFEEDFNKLFGHVLTCSSAEPEWLTAPWPFPEKEVFYENPRNSIKRFRLLKDRDTPNIEELKVTNKTITTTKPDRDPPRLLSNMTEGVHFQHTPYINRVKMETDPNGKDPNSTGAKVDAGKDRAWLFMAGFSRALREVAKVTTVGASKYTPNGWVDVPNGRDRYMDAFGRHLFDYGTGATVDDGPGGTNCLHQAQMIWNLLAALELELREKEKTNA